LSGRGSLPDGYNWFDEDATDALLASTGYQQPAGEHWRRSEIGLLLIIEPTHAPGYDEYMRQRREQQR
jgi:hypothetical protein